MAMLRRCENSKDVAYARYGGAGITVCAEWHDFWVFLRDMGPRPGLDHTLDRYPNGKGNYAPGNVRWADWDTQLNNTSQNVWLEFDGRRQTISQWARERGIGATTLHNRLKVGWSLERALTTPVKSG
jgi:hypothetical protein